jgi:hypothetical protein
MNETFYAKDEAKKKNELLMEIDKANEQKILFMDPPVYADFFLVPIFANNRMIFNFILTFKRDGKSNSNQMFGLGYLIPVMRKPDIFGIFCHLKIKS